MVDRPGLGAPLTTPRRARSGSGLGLVGPVIDHTAQRYGVLRYGVLV